MTTTWDIAVVGAGPAGATAALAAIRADPSLRVAMLDRSSFPRDKSCGDGIAPHVVDLLAGLGCAEAVVDGHTPVHRLRLQRREARADRRLARPTWVIPRADFDHRLVRAARDAGVTLLRRRVRTVRRHEDRIDLGCGTARVVIGADGAQSVVRREVAPAHGRMALALRGYAPTPAHLAGAQTIVFGHDRQPSYAWCFDRGDGLANVGYGELLPGRRSAPPRRELIAMLERLLPGTTPDAQAWRGAKLPLSNGGWRSGRGPVLLTGDAAGLVNPMTGEGIYYAVGTGVAAGRAAAAALAADAPESCERRYRAAVDDALARHLRHIAVAGLLCRQDVVLDAGLRASAADQAVFDALVELGLARGLVTPRVVSALARRLPAAIHDHRRRNP